MMRITFYYKTTEAGSYLIESFTKEQFSEDIEDLYYKPYGFDFVSNRTIVKGDGWSYKISKPTIDDIKSVICDDYCKFPRLIRDDEELASRCDKCPLNQLGDEK